MAQVVILNGMWADNPTQFTRPLGAHAIKSWMLQRGFDTVVIDWSQLWTYDEWCNILECVVGPETLVVGISATWIPTEGPGKDFLKALDRISRLYCHVRFVVGGSTEWVGYGDRCQRLEGTNYEDRLLEMVRSLNNSMHRHLIDPKWSIKNQLTEWNAADCVTPEEHLPLELGRGCIFKCNFCSHPNLGKPKGSYLRNPELVQHEVLRTNDLWGTTKWLLADDTVNEDPSKIETLRSMPHWFRWSGYLRADLIWSGRKESSIGSLAESGLTHAFFGIESFHPQASVAVGKAWSGKHAQRWLPELWEAFGSNVNLHCNFIVGLPGEDEGSLRRTHKWCKDHAHLGSFRFNALTLYTEKSQQRSFFTTNWSQYGYRKADADGSWENEHFNDREARALAEELNKDLPQVNGWLQAGIDVAVPSFKQQRLGAYLKALQ